MFEDKVTQRRFKDAANTSTYDQTIKYLSNKDSAREAAFQQHSLKEKKMSQLQGNKFFNKSVLELMSKMFGKRKKKDELWKKNTRMSKTILIFSKLVL